MSPAERLQGKYFHWGRVKARSWARWSDVRGYNFKVFFSMKMGHFGKEVESKKGNTENERT